MLGDIFGGGFRLYLLHKWMINLFFFMTLTIGWYKNCFASCARGRDGRCYGVLRAIHLFWKQCKVPSNNWYGEGRSIIRSHERYNLNNMEVQLGDMVEVGYKYVANRQWNITLHYVHHMVLTMPITRLGFRGFILPPSQITLPCTSSRFVPIGEVCRYNIWNGWE